jgi:hypothetical protein
MIKRPGNEAKNFHLSRAKDENLWNYISTLPYVAKCIRQILKSGRETHRNLPENSDIRPY